MVEISKLVKFYGRDLACDDINIKMMPGEITVLLGPNGAGKSTLIKCIAGLLKYEGNIKICGHNNKSVEAKKIMAYVPETPSVYNSLTIWEHLEFIARAYRLKDWRYRAESLINIFELENKKYNFGSQLSKGMRQKLSICCAILPDPKVVLFDEPLVGLDPLAIKTLKTMFVELKMSGVTVVISTHILDSVKDLWTKCVIMKDGRIAADYDRTDINSDFLEETFLDIVYD